MYELRTYTAVDGRMQDLLDRFEMHTLALFAKHGMESIGYWHPADRPEQLVYLIHHEDNPVTTWQTFKNDPRWHAAKSASEANGPLCISIESVFLEASSLHGVSRLGTADPTNA